MSCTLQYQAGGGGLKQRCGWLILQQLWLSTDQSLVLATCSHTHWCGVQSGWPCWAHQPTSPRGFACLPSAAAPYIHPNSHNRIAVTVYLHVHIELCLASYKAFKTSIHSMFPAIYDTKHISSSIRKVCYHILCFHVLVSREINYWSIIDIVIQYASSLLWLLVRLPPWLDGRKGFSQEHFCDDWFFKDFPFIVQYKRSRNST